MIETFSGQALSALQTCLEPLHALYLDCDGKAQLVHTVLQQLSIDHTCWLGTATCNATTERIEPHFWTELRSDEGDLFRVDYSLHQWTKANAPSGFFCAQSYADVTYNGELTDVWTVPTEFFALVQFDPRHQKIVTFDSLKALLLDHSETPDQLQPPPFPLSLLTPVTDAGCFLHNATHDLLFLRQ